MNNDISIVSTFKKDSGDTYVTYAYASNGAEIGYLEIKRFPNDQNTVTYQVDCLYVKEDYRKQGIAKKMFAKVEEKLDKSEGNYLSVRPNSFRYSNESTIDTATLYTIYEHLGFKLFKKENDFSSKDDEYLHDICKSLGINLQNPGVTRDTSNQLMIKKL